MKSGAVGLTSASEIDVGATVGAVAVGAVAASTVVGAAVGGAITGGLRIKFACAMMDLAWSFVYPAACNS